MVWSSPSPCSLERGWGRVGFPVPLGMSLGLGKKLYWRRNNETMPSLSVPSPSTRSHQGLLMLPGQGTLSNGRGCRAGAAPLPGSAGWAWHRRAVPLWLRGPGEPSCATLQCGSQGLLPPSASRRGVARADWDCRLFQQVSFLPLARGPSQAGDVWCCRVLFPFPAAALLQPCCHEAVCRGRTRCPVGYEGCAEGTVALALCTGRIWAAAGLERQPGSWLALDA